MEEKSEHLEKIQLAMECAKLDLFFESALAEEGLHEDMAAWEGLNTCQGQRVREEEGEP